jgi:hypothetical protein
MIRAIMRNKIVYCFLLGCCFFLHQQSQSQGLAGNPEKVLPKIYSTYIYHFTKYFLWPPNISREEFIIGVVESKTSEITVELKDMARTRQVNGQKLIIKEYRSVQAIDKGCHILYVPFESSNMLSEVLVKTQDQAVLVISNKEGLGKVGSPVNFITVNGKPSFELNEDALKKRSLKFAQQLKAIAIMI